MNKNLSKKRLLVLMQYFKTSTDETHPVSMPGLIDYLASQDIPAERRALYDDIEMLQAWGMDIVYSKGHGYFLGSRNFDLTEAKILSDAVAQASFISKAKTKSLLTRIMEPLSQYDQAILEQQIPLSSNKTPNETILYTIDTLMKAIAVNGCIRFRYFDYSYKLEKRYRKNASFYELIPYSLVWVEDRYYCIGYSPKHETFSNYRIDKMDQVEVIQEGCAKKRLNIPQYVESSFSMYHGTEKLVRLRLAKRLLPIMLDRFGTGVILEKQDETTITLSVRVTLSPPFLGWLLSFGKEVEVLGPQEVLTQIKKILFDLKKVYGA